jgi:hypothetical protein
MLAFIGCEGCGQKKWPIATQNDYNIIIMLRAPTMNFSTTITMAHFCCHRGDAAPSLPIWELPFVYISVLVITICRTKDVCRLTLKPNHWYVCQGTFRRRLNRFGWSCIVIVPVMSTTNAQRFRVHCWYNQIEYTCGCVPGVPCRRVQWKQTTLLIFSLRNDYNSMIYTSWTAVNDTIIFQANDSHSLWSPCLHDSKDKTRLRHRNQFLSVNGETIFVVFANTGRVILPFATLAYALSRERVKSLLDCNLPMLVKSEQLHKVWVYSKSSCTWHCRFGPHEPFYFSSLPFWIQTLIRNIGLNHLQAITLCVQWMTCWRIFTLASQLYVWETCDHMWEPSMPFQKEILVHQDAKIPVAAYSVRAWL